MRSSGIMIAIFYLTVVFFMGNALAYDDGFANAPTGTPQHPTLLNNYAVRPPWKVAGVDYPVGPKSTPTKDPATINMPGVDVSGRTVYVKGNNIKLDGYDFSKGGGWDVLIGIYGTGRNDTLINCNFKLQPTQGSGALIGGQSVGLVVEYCTFDQTGPGANIPGGSAWSIVSGGFSGTTVFKYNWFKNFPQHVLELGTNTKDTLINKYNLIENGGLQPGAHLNYQQFGDGAFVVTTQFNTTYQPHTNPTGGEGFQFYNNGTGSVNGTCAYNTMIYGPGGEGCVHVPGGAYNGTTSVTTYCNYIDKKNGGGFFYPDATSDIYCSNYNMVSGQLVPGESVCSFTQVINESQRPVSMRSIVLFNPATGDVTFQIPNHPVSAITVLNASGRIIRKLTSDTWDGMDMQGAQVKAGVYMYRYTSDGTPQWGKIFKQN
jgi:hypothetical protein